MFQEEKQYKVLTFKELVPICFQWTLVSIQLRWYLNSSRCMKKVI